MRIFILLSFLFVNQLVWSQNGNVTITDLNIAQQEKDQNRRAYIQSLRDYWTAFYEMRQLTLYDFEFRQLLYNPDAD